MNLLLLILVGTHLLLNTLLAQLEKLTVVYRIVVNFAQRNFNGTIGDIVDKRFIVRHKHHGICFCLNEALKPLNRLDIEVIGRFIEQ